MVPLFFYNATSGHPIAAHRRGDLALRLQRAANAVMIRRRYYGIKAARKRLLHRRRFRYSCREAGLCRDLAGLFSREPIPHHSKVAKWSP
jgi:hypothetical protein